MIKMAVMALLAVLLLATGCAVSPGADSTITLAGSDNSKTEDLAMGFSEAAFDDLNGRLVVVGHGWMVGEHEARLLTWNHDQQPVRSRWFRLTSEPPVDGNPRTWQIELVVDPAIPDSGKPSEFLRPNDIYTGRFTSARCSSGNMLRMEFDDVELTNIQKPSQTLTISAAINAERAYPEEIATMHRKFQLAFNYR